MFELKKLVSFIILVHKIANFYYAGMPKRGPSRGLKARRWREKHPNEKPYAKISETMLRVVGSKAAEFISDCSRWVREYCPLNSRYAYEISCIHISYHMLRC